MFAICFSRNGKIHRDLSFEAAPEEHRVQVASIPPGDANIFGHTEHVEDVVEDVEYICVKSPVFSYNRLPNVYPIQGVEMASTEEVATFGFDIKQTFIKSLIASGFKIRKKKKILIIIENDMDKYELINYIKRFRLYCIFNKFNI